MLLSFSLYNQIESSSSTVSIRGCAADLESPSTTSGKDTCTIPTNSSSVTASLELAHEASGGTGSADDAILALKQLLARKLFPRGTTCTAVQVVANDTSIMLVAECDITTAELTIYNPSSKLSVLIVGEYIYCTEGSAPDYAPSADADGNCYSYLVQDGDSCLALAAIYTITVDDVNSYNNDTWGWMGCDDLLANEYICLSSGYAPMPATISNAVCGPQVNGTVTAP
ncbi:hypothetical protein N7504_003662 [Penicillium tannophilum]|nr:hypothetical protein N7504_003662 [Penicillium tannophilum]